MDNYEIEFDTAKFKGNCDSGTFLTKFKYIDDNTIEATYHVFDNDKIVDKIVLKFNDNKFNYNMIIKQRYTTLLKLIEINDIELYSDILILGNLLDHYKSKFTFYNIISILSLSGAISFGYSISNLNSDFKTLIPAVLASVGISVLGVYSAYEKSKNKRIYSKNSDIMKENLDNNTKRFTRIKK